MRACPACTASNEPARRYCGQCAAALLWTCPRCAFGNGVADRFCGGCAAPSDVQAQPHPTTRPPAPAAPASSSRVTLAELQALIPAKPEPRASEPALPANVTQEALDRLFGANG